MQNFKKILAAFLVCAAIFPVAVSAENVSETYTVCGEFEQYDFSLFSDDNNIDSAVTYILDKIAENQPDTIDISQFDIKYTQECFDEFYIKLQNSMRFEHPELFYLSYYFNLEPNNTATFFKTLVMNKPVDVSDENGNITQIMPYTMDKDEIKKRQAIIDAETEHILSLTDDDMTPLQKVLTVHDYIASNYSYDLSLESSTLDTMIMQRKGVCQGYSYLFYHIMNKLDIPCINVPSNACGHIWNKVQLNGQWYNIDVTHDDPTSTDIDYSSGDKRTHFLMSDEELKNIESCNQHYAWNNEEYCPASDDSYKSSVLRSINSFTVYKNETFYAFDKNYKLCIIDFENNTLIPVDTTVSDSTWFTDNGYYYNKFSGLTLCAGRIYFNTPNNIYTFNPKTNTVELHYTYKNKKDSDTAHFYGLRTIDGKLYAEYSENPNKEPSLFEIPVPEAGLPCSSDIRPLTDNTIEIDFSIPDKYKDTIETFIPQYNDKGIFIGFAKPVTSSGDAKQQFEFFDECKTIKAFIWDNASYKPLSESVPYTVQ